MPSNHLILVIPFIPFSCLHSFPASGSFSMSQFFTSGGQSTGVSASASVLPMNIQDWFPLGLTSWISLQSKWLSRVFSNTTVQRHQFCGLNRTKGGGRRNSLLSHSALLFELGHLISCSQTETYTRNSPEDLNTLLTGDVLMLPVLVSTKIPWSIMC